MSISIQISGNAPAHLKDLGEGLSSDDVKKIAGRGVRSLLMDHLKDVDSSHVNKLGGRRTHYFEGAAKSVSFDTTEEGVNVSVKQTGIALHYYGGIVKPTGGRRFLTIPVDPEAYGKRAGEFNNLEIAWGLDKTGKRRPIGLVSRTETVTKERKNKKTGKTKTVTKYIPGKWLFALVYSATIPEDKSILPDNDAIQEAALTAIAEYSMAKLGRHI